MLYYSQGVTGNGTHLRVFGTHVVPIADGEGGGMAIEKRMDHAGKPAYRVRIATRHALTGRRANQTVGTFRTKREAEKAEANAITQREQGTLLKPDRTTVGELLDRWLEVDIPRTVKPENRVTYEVVIRKHLKPAFGTVLVRRLTVEAVERFYADLQSAGYSSSLIKKCHMRLSSALKLAQRWGLVTVNVCEVAKPPKIAYKQQKAWTPDEVGAFLIEAEDDGMHPYWSMALETGARTSELLGVSWHDLDLERGTVRFGQQVVRLLRGTPVVRQDAKTEAGRRTVRLTAYLVDELRTHRRRWLERKLAAPAWENPHDLVFCTGSGRPVNARHVRRSFDRLVAASGVTPISPHGMRRTHVTHAIGAGANLKAVAARVGHRDLTTTIRTYQQLTAGMEDELLAVVEAIVPRRSRATAP